MCAITRSLLAPQFTPANVNVHMGSVRREGGGWEGWAGVGGGKCLFEYSAELAGRSHVLMETNVRRPLSRRKNKKKKKTEAKNAGAEKQRVGGLAAAAKATASAARCCDLRGGQRKSNCDIALWLGIATQCNSAQ